MTLVFHRWLTQVLGVGACVAAALAGCKAPSFDECLVMCGIADRLCPSGMTCGADNYCHNAADVVCVNETPCTRRSCAAAGADCGAIDDGCGGTVECGACPAGRSCGGGGVPNLCGGTCTPTTCARAGANCGDLPDGCGAQIDCGQCGGGETCGGGGVANVCGSGSCTPTTCQAAGATCGALSDGCATTLDCGACPEGTACEGHQCVPSTTRPTGGPCVSDEECAGFNGERRCAQGDFKGGYCTNACAHDNDCAPGSHCTTEEVGDTAICVRNCTADSDCRADGYRCQNADGSTLADGTTGPPDECFPAATGDLPVGSACDAIWQCAGGDCLTEGSFPNSQGTFETVPLPGGYCSPGMCVPIFLPCPAGAVCGDSMQCMKPCAGDGDCRAGYHCIPSGFTSVILYCSPIVS